MSSRRTDVLYGVVEDATPETLDAEMASLISRIEEVEGEVSGSPQLVPLNFKYSDWHGASGTWSSYAPTSFMVIIAYTYQEKEEEE